MRSASHCGGGDGHHLAADPVDRVPVTVGHKGGVTSGELGQRFAGGGDGPYESPEGGGGGGAAKGASEALVP